MLLTLISCSKRVQHEDKLLKLAFQAVQKNSWDDFQRLLITLAEVTDGDLQLKTQQRQVQKEDFQRAVQGGKGQIDFNAFTYSGPGTMLAPVTLNETTTFTGHVYSLKLKSNSPAADVIDTQNLYPQFLVVKAKNEYRLLALVFVGD